MSQFGARLATLALVLASAALVRAETEDPARAARQRDARAQFQRGLELSAQENWVEARATFLRSVALMPRASSYFNLALVCLELGLGGAALDAIAAFEQLSLPDTERAREKVAPLRERAKGMVGTLLLSIEPTAAHVEIDGNLRPAAGAEHLLLLDPGVHSVRISAAGYVSEQRSVELAAGAAVHRRVELVRPPSAAPPVSPASVARAAQDADPRTAPAPSSPAARPAERALWQKPWFWVVIGSAAAVVAAGVTVAVIKLRPEHKSDPCPECDTLQPPPAR